MASLPVIAGQEMDEGLEGMWLGSAQGIQAIDAGKFAKYFCRCDQSILSFTSGLNWLKRRTVKNVLITSVGWASHFSASLFSTIFLSQFSCLFSRLPMIRNAIQFCSNRKLEESEAATCQDQKDNEKRRRNTSGIGKG